MVNSATLVLFCRRPVFGVGKQRLAADLGARTALALSELLLQAALEDVRAWSDPVIIAPAGAEDVDWVNGLPNIDCEVISQTNGNLGERISAGDALARARGHTCLLYMGSDAPILDQNYFKAARDALQRFDIVLGPASDGGVTLMGGRRPWPVLSGLPWSSADLAVTLEHACTTNGLSVMTLAERYDIDLKRDLPGLYRDLVNDVRPARQRLKEWIDGQDLGPDQ